MSAHWAGASARGAQAVGDPQNAGVPGHALAVGDVVLLTSYVIILLILNQIDIIFYCPVVSAAISLHIISVISNVTQLDWTCQTFLSNSCMSEFKNKSI